MAAENLCAEVEVKCEVGKYWNGIIDYVNLFPKAAPRYYKAIEVLEGDGISVGSLRLVHFGEGSPAIRYAKEKVEGLDNEKRTMVYSIIDGELMNYYKKYRTTVEVFPKADGDLGSLVKWSYEFEKVSDGIPEPTLVRDAALAFFIKLDEYLLEEA